MIDRRTPNEKILHHDASTIETAAGGPVDVAIVLGSGLSGVLPASFARKAIEYDLLLGMPVAILDGHSGEALAGTWNGKRVLALSGRVHLYQGFSPQQVTVGVRLAHAAGAKTVILTNAAATVDPSIATGDLMLISDQINLTGRNPLFGHADDPFVDMSDAYAARPRALAKQQAKPEHRLREGVYAGVSGPSFETRAEVTFLRTIGAHAVGMSTVLECIAARSMGMDVMGISVITNAAGEKTSHAHVTAAAGEGSARLGDLLDKIVSKL